MNADNRVYYEYTGPMDSRKSGWIDRTARRTDVRMEPTGSVHIVHPKIEMTCRVTDNPELPGFVITCKDEDGGQQELHVYLRPEAEHCGLSLRICHSVDTCSRLYEEDIIRKNYVVPFVDRKAATKI